MKLRGITAMCVTWVLMAGCSGGGQSPEQPATQTRDSTDAPSAAPTLDLAELSGLDVTGAIDTRIVWFEQTSPSCGIVTDEDGPSLLIVVSPVVEYGTVIRVHLFEGVGTYSAGGGGTAVYHGKNLLEAWNANDGTVSVETVGEDRIAGSLDIDLVPQPENAKGPIYLSGNWTCRLVLL